MNRYVALLRGINVGGRNPIRMSDLRACFEDHGFTRVTTYIQSGNVLFDSRERGRTGLARRIEEVLAEAFGYPASIVLRSRTEMRNVVAGAPPGFGTDPGRFRYDVIFLKEPLTAATAMKSVLTRPGVDEVSAGAGALYFSRLVAKASQSQLSRVVGHPLYQSMTIRNWNTTTRLLRMMDDT